MLTGRQVVVVLVRSGEREKFLPKIVLYVKEVADKEEFVEADGTPAWWNTM